MSGPARAGLLSHPGEEALLFCWQGEATAALDGVDYALKHYDVLYVPRGAAYRLAQAGGESKVIVCRAPAENTHPPFHAKRAEMSRDERRIRHLKGKDFAPLADLMRQQAHARGAQAGVSAAEAFRAHHAFKRARAW